MCFEEKKNTTEILRYVAVLYLCDSGIYDSSSEGQLLE